VHILILPSSYPRPYEKLSGIFYRDQARALKKNGVFTGVIDPDPRTLRTLLRKDAFLNRFQISYIDDSGIPTLRANDWCLPFARKLYAKHFISQAKRLFKLYVKRFGKPEIIHAHGILWGGVAARIIAREYNIPFVVTEHSSEYALNLIQEWQKPFIREVIKDASSIIAVSFSLISVLHSFGESKRFKVVPNVVDTDFFTKSGKKENQALFRFISIAPLDLKKGIDILLKAFASVFSDRQDIVIEIGGKGKDRDYLGQLVKDLGVASQVKILGVLSRAQVRDAFHRCDAFVLPSCYETFGLCYVEAMACGLPVIATRCGGPQDFVNHNNGYLVEVGNVEQTAKAMEDLYNNRDSWHGRSEAIRKYVIDSFSEAAIAGNLANIYQGLITGGTYHNE